jgi:hypothetical protein
MQSGEGVRKLSPEEAREVMKRSSTKAKKVEDRIEKLLKKSAQNPMELQEWANALAMVAGNIHGQVAKRHGIPDTHDANFLDALRQYAAMGAKLARQ